ncbi:MAG: hypothetical protein WCT26_04020 [Candidatus Buchananbacteria bacterium]
MEDALYKLNKKIFQARRRKQVGKIITAVGGSAADPPQKGHLQVLKKLYFSGKFVRIIWIISGEREDKHISVCPNDRIAMTELLVPRSMRAGNNPDLVFLYDGIYQDNIATIDWLEKILPVRYPNSEFHWFTGSDSVVPKAEFGGKCEIEARWVEGLRLYRQFPFIVIERGLYPLDGVKLPDNFTVIPGTVRDISSSKIRALIKEGKRFEHLTPKAVADYIKRHGLYIPNQTEGE